jgi:anti-sigma factor RsiW
MPLSDEDRAALSAYLDGELEEEALREVETRMSLEPNVRAEYEMMRRTWGLLEYLPRATPAPDFTSRTLERLAGEAARGLAGDRLRRYWAVVRRLPIAGLAWAAACLVAAGAGYAVGARLPRAALPEATPESDETLVRQLRVIEQWPLYEHAGDVDFLRRLEQSNLFGEEPGP